MTDAVRVSQADRLGVSRSSLYRAARDGRFDRIARGIYRAADAEPAEWEWVEAAARRPDATVCLTSALAYYDLTDAIPALLDVAVPRGSRRPATDSAIAWHLFDRATFGLDRDEIVIPGSGLRIGLYSAERTIADVFRLRGSLGYELGRDALREWLRRGGKPARLMAIATQLPRSRGPLEIALEALA
ncbi:type IV toxin-antitoxin system AbiEi family antitoxin domain-containing protein [Promicromonospora sp. MEB111]|uniref:type IV toxin-antitoxin system AbiEi family antitoxin domain-containing protein n=1 Tax=Promicromonospora sp. MEB111 TaxID=3040301 RepID=UPI00254A8B9B|nr:type IV toxin-antitoxin system AbiEi family antitoxin domain-containing protein [Promicromonospora sp. MEB111]